jgi:hypothetical protein
VLRQSGSGPGGLQSQSGASLPTSAVRDPRIGLSFAALWLPGFTLALRADVALPFGDLDAYASAGAMTGAPSAVARLEAGPVTVGAELGARLRPTIELGTLRQGSVLYAALGASVRLSPSLQLSLEAFALPSLVESTSARARELGVEVRSLPAEWLGAVRFLPASRVTLSLAAGCGLPLSTETVGSRSQWFFAATSPRFRGVLELGLGF